MDIENSESAFCESKKTISRIKALSGHGLKPSPELESTFGPINYITFLRDPIERHISHYNHARVRGYHNMSLKEWTQTLPENAELNYATKFLAGSEDVSLAKKVMKDTFSFVGLTERFDLSLVLMAQLVPLRDFDLRYERMNVARRRVIRASDLASDEREQLQSLNSLDCELYRFVTDELFVEYQNRYGENLAQDLKLFEDSNVGFGFGAGKRLAYKIQSLVRRHL